MRDDAIITFSAQLGRFLSATSPVLIVCQSAAIVSPDQTALPAWLQRTGNNEMVTGHLICIHVLPFLQQYTSQILSLSHYSCSHFLLNEMQKRANVPLLKISFHKKLRALLSVYIRNQIIITLVLCCSF